MREFFTVDAIKPLHGRNSDQEKILERVQVSAHGRVIGPPPAMSDVQNLNDVALNRKQNAIHIRSATVQELPDFG